MKLAAEELAWAAGLFEGEGCIRIGSLGPSNYGTLTLEMGHTDMQVIRVFAENWGGTVSAYKPSPNRKQAYHWVLAARQAAWCLGELLPYFKTTRVRTKAVLALAFQAQKRAGGHNGPGYRDQQAAFRDEMRRLNKRGAA